MSDIISFLPNGNIFVLYTNYYTLYAYMYMAIYNYLHWSRLKLTEMLIMDLLNCGKLQLYVLNNAQRSFKMPSRVFIIYNDRESSRGLSFRWPCSLVVLAVANHCHRLMVAPPFKAGNRMLL